VDSLALYDLLEKMIVPLFYRRENGIPHGWLAVAKEAIRTVAPVFSSRRMVKEYIESMYAPAVEVETA
jgi:starch phosphorylase